MTVKIEMDDITIDDSVYEKPFRKRFFVFVDNSPCVKCIHRVYCESSCEAFRDYVDRGAFHINDINKNLEEL